MKTTFKDYTSALETTLRRHADDPWVKVSEVDGLLYVQLSLLPLQTLLRTGWLLDTATQFLMTNQASWFRKGIQETLTINPAPLQIVDQPPVCDIYMTERFLSLENAPAPDTLAEKIVQGMLQRDREQYERDQFQSLILEAIQQSSQAPHTMRISLRPQGLT